ncbi:hypothetical protein [Smaragdicoccus niigatensis]|nr:hypothetical protein [Smaragdicoccus niigatensis]
MPSVEAIPVNLVELVNAGDLECECMACHLPLELKHGPVEWKLTWRFPGPYPVPGEDTMLLCEPCYRDWIEHPDELGGFPRASHRV